jgi:glycosyltransferase involved in cell wall biosynthesis
MPDILGQSMPADTIVVVVDRPTDAAERGALQANWPSVRFVFNGRNRGITASLNIGLANTDADIVFRADDDDCSAPTRFEEQLACFAETGADFVGTWGEGVADGNEARRYLIRCPTDDAGIRAALPGRNVLLHPSLAFRRTSVLALGGYDETFVNAQDYALYLAGIRAGCRFAAVPVPLVRRYYHSDNVSVKRRANQLMYSCAARVTHHAATGDRVAFLRTLSHYAMLAATPMWARVARRRVFKYIGRGA